jgi:hypothetical protein
VNQFLRDVREAKKRGRKEKRHKEAQAVLAAAAAAVASSSRNSTMRKDAKEDAAPANQEVFVVFGWSIEKLVRAAMDLTLFLRAEFPKTCCWIFKSWATDKGFIKVIQQQATTR